jgi:hypothetical protein
MASRRLPFRPPASWRTRAVWLLLAVAFSGSAPATAQSGAQAEAGPANYRLAARFAPYKITRMIYGTTAAPRWIEGTERFWYQWETAAGRSYYLVDPATGTRQTIFDNDRIAAELTRITKDPWDGQHLPIRSIKFLDANTLQFEVESSQDEERRDADAERGRQQQDQQLQQDTVRRQQDTVRQHQDSLRQRAQEECLPLPVRRAHPDAARAGRLAGARPPSALGQRVAGRADHRLRAALQPVLDVRRRVSQGARCPEGEDRGRSR